MYTDTPNLTEGNTGGHAAERKKDFMGKEVPFRPKGNASGTPRNLYPKAWDVHPKVWDICTKAWNIHPKLWDIKNNEGDKELRREEETKSSG